jgi:hypothetical protein
MSKKMATLGRAAAHQILRKGERCSLECVIMAKYVVTILIASQLFLFGCGNRGNHCSLSQDEILRFQRSIKTVEAFGIKDSVELTEFYDAVMFLKAKTGYEDQAYFGEVWGYFDEKKKTQDLEEWQNWLDNNCRL